MRVNETCAACLYDKQKTRSNDPAYLESVRRIIDQRRESDTSPYLVYLFNQAYEKQFGPGSSYAEIKKQFNDLVLSMEERIREIIETSPDPLAASMVYARIGNYIDYGAMNHVDEKTFLSLFENTSLSSHDRQVLDSLISQCKQADRFLLVADNCGEIVLDKLFLEQLKKQFPHLHLTVMVRGEEVLNDATEEDAACSGIADIAEVISNGTSVAGTIYDMISEEAKTALDRADVILAKGQGNYESLCGQGRHIFYSFLCKCGLFTERFQVPKLTGMLVEE